MRRMAMLIALVSSGTAWAGPPESIRTQGRFLDADGGAINAEQALLRLQVRSEDGACLLYEELHSGVVLSDGYFAVSLGEGVQVTNTAPDLGLQDAFRNGEPYTDARLGCGTFAPAPNAARLLRVNATISGQTHTLTPDQPIGSVPYALVASGLDGGATIQLGDEPATCDAEASGLLTFRDGTMLVCDGTGWMQVPLQATDADLSTSPATVAGMDLPGGVSPGAWHTVTVTNSGPGATGTLSTQLSDSTWFETGADTCDGTTLGDQQFCTVEVRANGSGNGSYSATLTVGDSSFDASAALSGTADGFGCGVDQYMDGGSCIAVGNGYYSPDGDASRYSCSGKPSNSTYTSSGGGTNSCSWSCTSPWQQNGNSCEIPNNCTPGKAPQTYNNPTVRGKRIGAGALASLRAYCSSQGYCRQTSQYYFEHLNNYGHDNGGRNPPAVDMLNLHPACADFGTTYPQTTQEMAGSGQTNPWCNYSAYEVAEGSGYRFLITWVRCEEG